MLEGQDEVLQHEVVVEGLAEELLLQPAEELIVHGQEPASEQSGQGTVSPGQPDVRHPETGLVVSLVEVEAGDVLHEHLANLPSLQEDSDVLVEPGLVPQAQAVDLLPLHGRLVHKLASHDDRGVLGEGDALHAVVVGLFLRLPVEAVNSLVQGVAGSVLQADVGFVLHHCQGDLH